MFKRDKRKKEALGRVGRVERENRYNKIITISTIAIVSAIIILVVGGAFWEGVVKSNQVIVTVNGNEVTTREFQKYARYERDRSINSYQVYYTYVASVYTYMDETTVNNALQQLSYMQYELEPAIAGQNAMTNMIQNILIEEEAKKMDIEVTDQELNDFIHSSYRYYPNGTLTPTATMKIAPTSTYSPTQLALITLEPTATIFSDSTPSPTSAAEIDTSLPTTEPMTFEEYQSEYNRDIEQKMDTLKITEDEFIQYTKANLLRQKMMDFITKDVPHEQEQVWARHIIVEDESTANEVFNKLQTGEDFTQLAAEYSTDGTAGSGGDLGWFCYEDMISDFSEVAFILEIGEFSDPFQSGFGWHVLQVLGHELRPLTPTEYKQLKNQEFEAWLNEKMDQAEIEYNIDDWVSRSPDEPVIPATMRLQ